MNREIVDKFNQLQIKSKYKSTFDISIYDFFFKKGFFKSSPPSGIPKLLNALSDCSECYYGLQIDSYAEGCFHDCEYCWAKSDLSKSNSWNNPMPLPINISEFWELFYTIFETEDAHPLREVIERKTPLRIGSLSDPFMAMDKKYGITLELIKILNFYKYPTVFLTRSHYVTDDRYMDYLDPDLFSIQMSLPSLNEDFTRVIEPGAPSPKLRLQALKKLSDANIWCTVRLNPLFPIYPDGTLSRDLSTDAKTNFFEFDYIDELALYGCKSLLTGFVHLDEKVVELIHKKTQVDLMGFMSSDMKEMVEGFAYSGDEIRKYYEIIKERCQRNKIEFSTCYLGLGESYFWKDQDLWDNKEDCCNIKNRVPSFINETRMIPVSERLKIDNPDMKYIERVIHRFWQSFKSFFFKKVYEK
ncbi:radical SAM protein [Halobacteriovorax sp.]|uniref:SPL family radical SAM protein n=1 Tax=Halobacteriovorax sp. TaxID=2020862 RepID=UPI00356AD662